MAIRAIESGRSPALLDVPGGPLRVPAAAPGAVQLSLVLPTRNEARNLEELVRRLTAVLDERIPGAYELIVVDDDSPDRTWSVALELASRYPALRVMRRRGEKGLSTAVIRGWQAARGAILGVIDADLQHPPELVGKLWAATANGADLAVGTRHARGGGVSDWCLRRRALSRGAQLLGLALLPSVVGRLSDPMSGCFFVRRGAIASAELSPVGYKILVEVLGRGKVRRIAEVPYVFCERKAGESKVTARVYVDYVAHLFRLRVATLPPRFARFAVVGFCGVIVDMAILFLLRDSLHMGLTAAKALSFETATAHNFWFNDRWTFGDVARARGMGATRLRRFAVYNAICACALALSVVLINAQVLLLGMNPYVANAVTIAIATAWNFFMNKAFTWGPQGGAQLEPAAVQRRAAS